MNPWLNKIKLNNITASVRSLGPKWEAGTLVIQRFKTAMLFTTNLNSV